MNNRIGRVNKLIKKELGKIIVAEIDLEKNGITTITRVESVPNLTETFVYISIIGGKKDKIFNALQKNIYHLQKKLNKKLNMRPVPKIIFREERETEKAEKIEKILEKIKRNDIV